MRGGQEIEQERRLELLDLVPQGAGVLLGHGRAELGVLVHPFACLDLPLKLDGGIVGEEEGSVAQVLFEIGTVGAGGEDAALVAVGRQEQDFAVTGVDGA